jgi:hypothetical protein
MNYRSDYLKFATLPPIDREGLWEVAKFVEHIHHYPFNIFGTLLQCLQHSNYQILNKV